MVDYLGVDGGSLDLSINIPQSLPRRPTNNDLSIYYDEEPIVAINPLDVTSGMSQFVYDGFNDVSKYGHVDYNLFHNYIPPKLSGFLDCYLDYMSGGPDSYSKFKDIWKNPIILSVKDDVFMGAVFSIKKSDIF